MNPYLLLASISCCLIVYTLSVLLLNAFNVSVGWSLLLPYLLFISTFIFVERKKRQKSDSNSRRQLNAELASVDWQPVEVRPTDFGSNDQPLAEFGDNSRQSLPNKQTSFKPKQRSDKTNKLPREHSVDEHTAL